MTTSTTLVAGDTLSFEVSAPTAADGSAYKASDGWQLVYRLVPRSGAATAITLTAIADGDDYLVQVPAATTATWAAGWYSVGAYVTLGLESYTVEPAFAQAEIRANPRTVAAGFDGRSVAAKALDDARAAYASAMQAAASNVGSQQLQRYQIGDRVMEYASPEKAVAALRRAVQDWALAVDYENACAQGRATGPMGRMKFGVPNG
jgi:hypothetical protein